MSVSEFKHKISWVPRSRPIQRYLKYLANLIDVDRLKDKYSMIVWKSGLESGDSEFANPVGRDPLLLGAEA